MTNMYHLEDNTITTEDTPLDDTILGGLGHVYFKYMKKHGEKTAQVDADTGERDTFQSLLQKCIRTSIALRKRGIAKGDLIVYYSGIHINACVPVIASYFIGAIPLFLDIAIPSSEISYLLKQVNPKLLLTEPENFKNIKNIMRNIGIDTETVVFYCDFFKQQEEEAFFQPIYVKNLEETAAIHFSSGSTGFPKGICLNHYTFLCFNRVESNWRERENKVILSHGSLYWIGGTLRLVSLIRQGACHLIVSHFDAKKIWNLIEIFKVNVVHLLPFHIIKMYEHGKPYGINTSSLEIIVTQGSNLPKPYIKGLQEILPDTEILQIYGLTEVGLLTQFRKNKVHQEYIKSKIGSVGAPVQGYGISYKVVDLRTGENLGPNKPGELLVKGKTVMNGYYNLESSDQFDKDGWLKTGDILYYDDDYYFFVIDRIKHMLIYRGSHYSPASLENELMTHPAVEQAVVIGIPHDSEIEYPLALVTLNKNYGNVTATEIEKYMNENISDGNKLKARVRVVDNFPLTVTGKVKRQELKKIILLSL